MNKEEKPIKFHFLIPNDLNILGKISYTSLEIPYSKLKDVSWISGFFAKGMLHQIIIFLVC